MHFQAPLVGALLFLGAQVQGCPAKRPKTTSTSKISSTSTFSSAGQAPTTSAGTSGTSSGSVPSSTAGNGASSSSSSSSSSGLGSSSESVVVTATTSPGSSGPTTTSASRSETGTSAAGNGDAQSSSRSGLDSSSSSVQTTPTTTRNPISTTASASVSQTTSASVSQTTSATTSNAPPATTSSVTPPGTTSLARTYPADVVDKLRDASIPKLEAYLAKAGALNGCTLEKASIRREWSDLTPKEREAYTTAVKCLQAASPKSNGREIPGARSRFDDFLAVHIQQTPFVHETANFLSWHRYYMWAYEKALKEECGYAGQHPYWNWDRYAKDPANSPLFNGNASSMSGNSARPGACITNGPFAGMKVNMGPGQNLNFNPRCITRSISKTYAAATTADKVIRVIQNSNSIEAFQNTLQAVPNGVHSGGHFTIGGDPGGDVYISPGDPAFYLHHAAIDRTWWLWQIQDLAARQTVGGKTNRSGPNGKITDEVHLGVNAGPVQLKDLMNTMGGLNGQMCYIYV